MSVILFGVEWFERIGATLLGYASTTHYYGPVVVATVCPGRDYSERFERAKTLETASPEIVEFVNDLHRSNVSAWNMTYDEGQPVGKIGLAEFGCGPKPYGPLEFIKVLHAMSYNMVSNDGDEHSFRGAYKKLESLIHCLERNYIQNLPEYNALPWA